MVHELIKSRQPDLAKFCQQRKVRRLELFGSATKDAFDPGASDLDFLVEFEPLAPTDHADSYFGLLHGLEDLFARRIDLVERAPIRNPYLLAAIGESEVVLYEAA